MGEEMLEEAIKTEEESTPSEAVPEAEQQDIQAEKPESEQKSEADIEAEKQQNQQHALRRKTTKQAKELRESKARIAELESKASETKSPIADDYENYDDFIKASIDHGIKQGQPTSTYNPIDDYASELTASGNAKYDDFEKKAWASKEMLPILEEFENAADIAYYLGSNPQDAQRIQGLSNVGMAREFARIEAKVNQPKPRTTTAPKPVVPIETSAKTTVDTTNESMEQYAARRNKEQYG